MEKLPLWLGGSNESAKVMNSNLRVLVVAKETSSTVTISRHLQQAVLKGLFRVRVERSLVCLAKQPGHSLCA